MKFSTRLSTLLIAGTLLSLAGTAQSQVFPSKPIRIIVPSGPGSSSDTAARIISPEMTKHLGQPIIIENKPGANSIIGSEYVAKQAPADGYTLLMNSHTGLVSLPIITKDLRFDPIKDLPPVIGLTQGRFVWLVSSTLPWKNIAEQSVAVRANPGKYNWGSGDPATQLLGHAIMRELGLHAITTFIPYPAPAPFTRAVLSGEIQLSITAQSAVAPFGDQVRLLAVTGDKRRPDLPDVPTFSEAGLSNIPGLNWMLNVRAGTPEAAASALHAAASQGLKNPEVIARYAKLTMEISNLPPAVAAKVMVDTHRVFVEAANKAGVKPE